MVKFQWLYATLADLTWWQRLLWVVYLIYFITRSYKYWIETEHGLRKGYRRMIFGYNKEIRLYHILLIIFDIPPAIIGLTFPILKRILSFKIYTFKEKDKKGVVDEDKN